MSEASMKSTLVKALKPLDAVAIESPMTGLGIPDVETICGWIECKAMKTWPKNADTKPVRFPHPLMQEQKVWIYRRSRMGGVAIVAAKVSNEWFFFDGLRIKDQWEKMTRLEMRQIAELHFSKGLDKIKLIDYLQQKALNLLQGKYSSFNEDV